MGIWRVIAAMSLVLWSVATLPSPAWADPLNCPPLCDRIPDSAWTAASALPLHHEYHWPGLAGLAVTATAPRFRFEEECGLPPVPGDPRGYAVAAKAEVWSDDGNWRLQSQIVHWRGETWRGGQTALAVVQGAAAALRGCPPTPPRSVTTDVPGRLAAVFDLDGGRELHEYVLADPRNSTIVELALWSRRPSQVQWAAPTDDQVFSALQDPLCTAYLGSCR